MYFTIKMEFGTGRGSNNTVLEKLGRFFYLINPYTHRYEHIKDVPDIVIDVSTKFEIMTSPLQRIRDFQLTG